jgi:hypothetical protein
VRLLCAPPLRCRVCSCLIECTNER